MSKDSRVGDLGSKCGDILSLVHVKMVLPSLFSRPSDERFSN
jgi:hypothetical protein